MMTEPRSMRSSKLKKGVTKMVEESNEDGERADGSAEDEEEEMDYDEVLVTSGTNNPKPPRLGEGFKLEANDKQSRADMTDLVGNMSVYFARLKRIHNAKM